MPGADTTRQRARVRASRLCQVGWKISTPYRCRTFFSVIPIVSAAIIIVAFPFAFAFALLGFTVATSTVLPGAIVGITLPKFVVPLLLLPRIIIARIAIDF